MSEITEAIINGRTYKIGDKFTQWTDATIVMFVKCEDGSILPILSKRNLHEAILESGLLTYRTLPGPKTE